MDKHRRWQSLLILAVIALTVYNILPTLFFYTKPLDSPINKAKAEEIALSAIERVNSLEEGSKQWLASYCKLLKIKPASIAISAENPQIVDIQFNNSSDADKFKKYLPRAGNLISFYPATLALDPENVLDDSADGSKVSILRKIPVHFEKSQLDTLFTFGEKKNADGSFTSTYKELLQDRLSEVCYAVGGPSENAQLVSLALQAQQTPRGSELLLVVAQNIYNYQKAFGIDSPITKRFYRTFGVQGSINALTEALDKLKDRIHGQKVALKIEEEKRQKEGSFLDSAQKSALIALQTQEETLLAATAALKNQKAAFISVDPVWSKQTALKIAGANTSIDTRKQNPIVKSISIDETEQAFVIELQDDVVNLRNSGRSQDLVNQIIYDEIAKISRMSSEELKPHHTGYLIHLSNLTDSTTFLRLDLSQIAAAQITQMKGLIKSSWNPEEKSLQEDVYPIVSWEELQALPKSQRRLSLVLYAPSMSQGEIPAGFKTNSLYVIAKDMLKLANQHQNAPQSDEAKQFTKDFFKLDRMLRDHGFVSYPGTTYPLSLEYANDIIFEAQDFYLPVLQATREDFSVHGTKKFAVLEFSDVKQRILTQNKIDTAIHEDLLKWRDEYNACQVDISGATYFDVPKPTANPLINNLVLSAKKYFRGDDRKILRWGLDMSGGKTVQVQLRDISGRAVTNEADIRQGINELYNRVNKMGVSEVSIRQEGSSITLDFPGSQALSASDLVKASSMTFHVVNEKFAIGSSHPLSETVNRFLQEVWNEAVVTNKKDAESVNLIAWSHLYGDSLDPDAVMPRTEAARILYENGLKLANPNNPDMNSSFNDTVSKVAMYQGEYFTDWGNQTHPLMLVFNNYALEGSSLDNVRANYDPTKGNFLSFDIKNSQVLSSGERIYPRNELFSWTSVFSKEKIAGTPYEAFSNGKGWRMAVILNGKVVSSPTLDGALRDSAMISGHFTQREINRLVADLKAGSLTFTPQILSEKNISPELGMKERYQGILATVIALLAVIAVMVSYYRFAGLIASIAVLFNLLIIWATLQNIGAAVTLANIAGIILTVGMAVDANVLVFERVREEFAKTGKIAISVAAGYKKAFSAILDSNVTTIIAALVLLNFDSGPVRGFAVSLIIGIVSSMFTALFMTKYFFSRWVQNPDHKSLTMMNLIKSHHFDFLKWGRLSMTFSALMVVVGAFFLTQNYQTLLGIDFTGGLTTSIEVEAKPDTNYRKVVESALVSHGASMQDIQVRELSPTNQLRIFFGTSMNLPGKPFDGMPSEISIEDPRYSYETNPRLVWLVKALEEGGLTLTEKSKNQIDQNWRNISGQMSDTMRNNAAIGLLIALACILVYITLRFEFSYAISATIGLAFDVLITIAILAILHACGMPIQVDLNTVAAIMTIVGYSLNDTIIVFDRVREDIGVMKRSSLKAIINHSLNVTLSRTIMTSFTTFIVLLALVLFGGSSIFGFSFIMAIGVVVGTLSTFFIAAPLLIVFQRSEDTEEPLVIN
ncbi:MAG: protein translocase subunit SecD [Chlamydiae bacterium]|nr:protein translocase subunit SecD [Chlamydiota bacterium]